MRNRRKLLDRTSAIRGDATYTLQLPTIIKPLTMSTSTRDLHKGRDRSRSPTNHSHSRRSRSPHSHRHHILSKRSKPSAPVPLPFQALRLSKHDFQKYKPIFGLYLDIQKHIVLEELPEEEVKGRWKSFLGKWYDCLPLHASRSCIQILTSLRHSQARC